MYSTRFQHDHFTWNDVPDVSASAVSGDPRALGDPVITEMVLTANPIAFMLDAYRQILMHDTAPGMLHLMAIGLGSTVVLIATVLVMRSSSQYLALKALTE